MKGELKQIGQELLLESMEPKPRTRLLKNREREKGRRILREREGKRKKKRRDGGVSGDGLTVKSVSPPPPSPSEPPLETLLHRREDETLTPFEIESQREAQKATDEHHAANLDSAEVKEKGRREDTLSHTHDSISGIGTSKRKILTAAVAAGGAEGEKNADEQETQKSKKDIADKLVEQIDTFELLKVKPQNNKIRINLPPRHFVMCPNPRMQKLLGWCRFNEKVPANVHMVQQVSTKGEEVGIGIGESSSRYGNPSYDRIRSILLPETCDFGRNNRTLYVYCNLVKSSFIGNALCPILRICDISSINTLKNPVIYRNYDNPQYHPIKKQIFQKIEFNLCNDLGECFPFQHGENTTVVLKFRKIRLPFNKREGWLRGGGY
jgi:hypothetical protein